MYDYYVWWTKLWSLLIVLCGSRISSWFLLMMGVEVVMLTIHILVLPFVFGRLEEKCSTKANQQSKIVDIALIVLNDSSDKVFPLLLSWTGIWLMESMQSATFVSVLLSPPAQESFHLWNLGFFIQVLLIVCSVANILSHVEIIGFRYWGRKLRKWKLNTISWCWLDMIWYPFILVLDT